MNRRTFRALAIGLLCLTVAFLASCFCTAEKSAVVQIRATHDILAKNYMKYVKADAAAQVAAKKMTQQEADAFVDDAQKLIDSDARNIDALQKSLEQ